MTVTNSRWVASLCLVLLAAGCAKEEVVHDLSEAEANQIKLVLEAAGIKAAKEKQEGGRTVAYKIVVPGGDAFESLKVLVNNQLPRPKVMGLDKVYDPANKGLIPTSTEELAGFQLALQNEIVRKLTTVPGVVDAHVTINKPKVDVVRMMDAKPPPPTASVVVVYNLVDNRVPLKEPDVQRLVASCVEGLEPGNVQVLLSPNRPAERLAGAADNGEGGGIDPAQMPSFVGVKVADEANKKRVTGLFTGLGALLFLVLVAFALALVAAIRANGKLTAANAQVMALAKKAKGEAPPPVG